MAQARAVGVAVLAAAALATAAAAAPGAPRTRETVRGEVAAHHVLLRAADLGKGWKASAAPSGGSDTVCKGLRPNLSGLVQVGYAVAPTFSLGQLATVTQRVRVFASAAQQGKAWLRTDSIGLVLCLEKELQSATFSKATVRVGGQYRLDFGKLAPHVDGFRVVAAVAPKDEKAFRVYADVLLLGRGPTLTTVTFLGFLQPVDSALEQRVARTLAERLGAKSSLAG